MSEIKVNKLTPRTNCGTTTLGDSGDTINIPAGVTISNNGTATGFGATGAVNWDVASIKTVDFTATSGVGYFVDTATTGAVEVTLPAAPAAGDVVGVADYANNFETANCTLNRNGLKIGGNATNSVMSTNGAAVTLVYVDVTKGWIVTDSGNQSDAPGPLYVTATGGCITTTGNYKIHTFYSPGTFCISCTGNSAGSSQAEYLIVGGGGGGGNYGAGGGGAGGYRETPGTSAGSYTVSPIAGSVAVLCATASAFPVQVGGGGAGRSTPRGNATKGCASSFNGETSTGGGYGTGANDTAGGPGGSGGGGSGGGPPGTSNPASGGTGNQPVTSPAQGTNGGNGYDGQVSNTQGGGGGGATVAGSNASNATGGNGGAGAGTAINLTTMPAPSPTPSAQIGTPGPSPAVRYFAGGGAGATDNAGGPGGTGGTGGVGGGGSAPAMTGSCSGNPGTISTGGGGSGAGGGDNPSVNGGAGGSGIVVIRYKYQ